MREDRGWWGRALLAGAGLLGAAGVIVGAAGAHLGGGNFAQLASTFLLLHAAAIPGLLGAPIGSEKARRIVASLLACGAALFSGDLGWLSFTGRTLVSGMAPLGGLLLISGWLGLCVTAIWPGHRSSMSR